MTTTCLCANSNLVPVLGCDSTSRSCPHKLLDAMAEEPVTDGWVVNDSSAAARSSVRIIGTDEMGKIWLLVISCTVRKEHSGEANGVHHLSWGCDST